jgi:hypothetical protein
MGGVHDASVPPVLPEVILPLHVGDIAVGAAVVGRVEDGRVAAPAPVHQTRGARYIAEAIPSQVPVEDACLGAFGMVCPWKSSRAVW